MILAKDIEEERGRNSFTSLPEPQSDENEDDWALLACCFSSASENLKKSK